jgi:signal peptidase I
LARKQGAKGDKKPINTLPFYIGLVILFILFIYYQGHGEISSILGIALFLMIVVLIILEITVGIEEEGFKKNIIEIGAAILIVVVFWFSLEYFLHTNYPLDVVPSCSMLPQLKRGDLIVLHGIQSVSQLNSPIINIRNSDYNSFNSSISNEFLSCVAYQINGNRVSISQIIRPGYTIGLYRSSQSGGQIVPSTSQQGNLVQYTCGSKSIIFENGTTEQEAYTTVVTINGTTIYKDTNNSVIVYATIPSDYFYALGDSYIVHRAYAILNISGKYFVLTKGDNNPGLDMQYGNYPIAMKYVNGKVISSIPYLGYLKLVLSNSFVEPAGCNSTVVNN